MTAKTTALERAIQRNDWERVALALLVALAAAARVAPPGRIDELLDALSGEEPADGPGRA